MLQHATRGTCPVRVACPHLTLKAGSTVRPGSLKTSVKGNRLSLLPHLSAHRSRESRNSIACASSSSLVGGSYQDKTPPKEISGPGYGVFLLLLLTIVIFVADKVLHIPGSQALYLSHSHPQWWQFITHMFCHANWGHLSGNMFHLCIFGKLVEETEGGFGVWFVYLMCGLGAALITFAATCLGPATAGASLGGSGAVFGLFAVSVLTRIKWDIRRLLEAAVLGQFVVRQVMDEVKNQVSGGLLVGGLQVSHLAHLGGAFAGVMLVMLITRLPQAKEE